MAGERATDRRRRMRKILMAAAGLAVGYVAGAVIGWEMVPRISSNAHDLGL
jgi:hypothetical protein